MALTTSIKRAPRWAWFTVAGVSAGAIGIKLWKDRAADPTTDPGTEVGDPVYGPSGSPTPVITPPVIIGGSSGDDGALSQFVSILGGNFDTLVTSLTDLAGGDQALAGQLAGGLVDLSGQALDLAAAGSAPAPYSGTPIVVNIPAPSPGPAPYPAPAPTPRGCPPGFPVYNPANGAPGKNSCYKNCGHDICKNHKKTRDHGHCYQSGKRVHTSFEVVGGRC